MKKFYLLAAIVVAGFLAGCVNDDAIDLKKYENYEKNFIEKFGEVDKGHNFNMVRAVDITADAPFSNYTLKVYDNTPGVGLGAHLLGEFKNVNPGMVLKCDVPRTVSTLHFAYEHDGLTQYSVELVAPDNKVKAKMASVGTQQEFLQTFSIYHQDETDRANYPENPNISFPEGFNENNWKNDLTDGSVLINNENRGTDEAGKKWGVFSKAFYRFLQGTQTDGSYNGILPFNLFKHAEDHSAYASDFTFEYDTRKNGAIDYITFYPMEYEAGRHDVVGYYIYDIETKAIKAQVDVYENNVDVDQYRLVGNDADIHIHYDPNFLAVARGTADITNASTFTPTGYLQFPAKEFTLDSYVPVYDSPSSLTCLRITNTQDAEGNGIALGAYDDGTVTNPNYSAMGWVPTYDSGQVTFNTTARFVYEFYHQGNQASTFSFAKDVKLSQGLYKLEADGFLRQGYDGTATDSWVKLEANGGHRVLYNETTKEVEQYDNVPDVWMTNWTALSDKTDASYPNQLFLNNTNSDQYANWWMNQGKCVNTRYFYLDNSVDGHFSTDVQVKINGSFGATAGSWFAGGNIRLYKLSNRVPYSDCRAVLGQPCTVGLKPGEGLGFYVRERAYWNVDQVETGEVDITEGVLTDPKVAETNRRRMATRKSVDAEGMTTFYSESARNPNNHKQCLYASIQFTDESNGTTTTTDYGVIGLEDIGLDEASADNDYNDIMIFIERTATMEPEKPIVYTIAYEDLGTTDDFDFNDLVLTLEHVSGQTTGTLKAHCAGGHLPLQLNFGDYIIWNSVHNVFGYSPSAKFYRDGNEYTGDNVIINTNAGTYVEALPLQYPYAETQTIPTFVFDENTILLPSDFTVSDDAKEFIVTVTYDDGQNSNTQIRISPIDLSEEDPGRVPQAIVLVTDSWLWPKERADIIKGYPLYKEWVQDKSKLEWINPSNRQDEYLYESPFPSESSDTGN